MLLIIAKGSKPELHMMYATTKTALVKACDMTHVHEVRDVDELDEDWLRERSV